jgi:glycosyltransferase involved in cell wall biosynthesis
VPEEKIAFIHHGIPDTPFIDSSFYKDKFGVEGKKVLLTFGLLSPNKGIENVLQALPAVIKNTRMWSILSWAQPTRIF